MRARRGLYNLMAAVGSQLVILLLGLIIPRLTLTNYGSETNGFMSLVVQVYSYIALLEAGLGTAEIQALYGPVTRQDRRMISCAVNTAQKYYRRVTLQYGGVVVAGAALLPLAVASELPPWQMSVYFLLFGISRLVNFWFVASLRPLLEVEGKNYVNTGIDFVFNIGSTLVRALLLFFGVDLLLLQAVYSVINTAQVLVYFFYFRRNYSWLDRSVPVDDSLLRHRSAFLLQQIGQLVFSCTDIILISVFCDLKATSVYAVYMLVFNALSTVLHLMTSSTQFVLGQAYHEDQQKYREIHRVYETGLLAAAFVLYTTAYVLMLPFVELYTAGVTDADYLDGALPLLFCLFGVLTTCRYVPLNLVNVSGHARQTMKQNALEVGLNVVISLLLVPLLGIRGALIGSCVALVYRVAALTVYCNRRIMDWPLLRGFRLYGTNLLLFAAVALVKARLPLSIGSYGQFLLAGCVTVAVMAALFGGVNLAMNYGFLQPYLKWFFSLAGQKLRRKPE